MDAMIVKTHGGKGLTIHDEHIFYHTWATKQLKKHYESITKALRKHESNMKAEILIKVIKKTDIDGYIPSASHTGIKDPEEKR